MKLLELAIGPEDYDRRWVVRVVVLGFGLELGRGVDVGYFAAAEWLWPRVIVEDFHWWESWYLEFHHRAFYLDTLTGALKRWWARCAWNADRMEDPFQ